MSRLQALIKGFLILCKLLFTDFGRFVEIVRPFPPKSCVVDDDTIAEWLKTGQKFGVASVPFGNWHRNFAPSSSNMRIADQLAELVKINGELRERIFTQEEIAVGLLLRRPRIVLPEEHVLYPDDLREWVQSDRFLRWCYVQILGKLIFLDQRSHVYRCWLIAKSLGMDALVHARSFEVKKYDLCCGQWWCQSPLVYWPWEYLARLVLLGEGKI